MFNLAQALRLTGHADQAIPLLERRLQNPDQRATVEHELALAKGQRRAAAPRRAARRSRRRTSPAKARSRARGPRAIRGFADFVASARAEVQAEAARNADDRFWILEPSLMVPPDGLRPLDDPEVRALVRGGMRGLLEAVDGDRVALALHVDIGLDEDLFAAIVLSVAGAMAISTQYARVERDDAGLPSLGPWTTAPELSDELVEAARRTLGD